MAGIPFPPSYRVVRHAEHPELEEQSWVIKQASWPEFMFHDAVAGRLYGRLYRDFPAFQTYLVDASGRVVAAGNAIPFRWEGGPLPERGWDAVLEAGVSDHESGRAPSALSALEIVVDPAERGRWLSAHMVGAMRDLAAGSGFSHLVAPVRPSHKADHPLVPMERYVEWTRRDGLAFDPWMRVHQRAGATIGRVAPASMRITGTVEDWETWTGMTFPATGTYVVPGALVPVEIDRREGTGIYLEPNVWMLHRLAPPGRGPERPAQFM